MTQELHSLRFSERHYNIVEYKPLLGFLFLEDWFPPSAPLAHATLVSTAVLDDLIASCYRIWRSAVDSITSDHLLGNNTANKYVQ